MLQIYFIYSKIQVLMSSGDIENKRTLFDRLRDNYRLVVIDDHDFKEVNTFKFNLLTLYTLVSTIVVVLCTVAVSLIIFTPVKRFIPGYGDIEDNTAYIELRKKVDEMDEAFKAQDVYNLGLRNLLQGISDEQVSTETKEVTTVSNANVQEANKTSELSQFVFANPISGTISAKYDPNIQHFGVDILAPKNTAIKSILSGIVILSDWTVDGGNTVVIQHARNVSSVYKHNSALLVKTGDRIKTGQAIAIIGNTGKLSTGPHLHLELWYNGNPINPSNYVSFN